MQDRSDWLSDIAVRGVRSTDVVGSARPNEIRIMTTDTRVATECVSAKDIRIRLRLCVTRGIVERCDDSRSTRARVPFR